MPHTQGPWHCHKDTPTTVKNSAGDWIADCEMHHISYAKRFRDEREANARLIAAAPDLLAAIIKLTTAIREDMPNFSQKQWPEYSDACAAIAKATGGA